MARARADSAYIQKSPPEGEALNPSGRLTDVFLVLHALVEGSGIAWISP